MLNEKKIMENWKYGSNISPIISCCCITFNQKNYIRDAIDSMLIQKTEYAFEIIVHDDMSTDGTREILKEYENKFPNIIKPIYQDHNQWSLDNRIMPIVFRYAKGQFMALCEGDDYWTDQNKLQLQIDEMYKFPDCNISFHYGEIKYENILNKTELFCKHSSENKFFTTNEVIQYAGPLMPTASICLTKKFTDSIVERSNEKFFKKDLTALFIQILSSVDGNARYINKNMCVYRRMGNGSWTENTAKDYKMHLHWVMKSINSINKVNNLTDHIYNKELKRLQNKYYMNLMYYSIIPLKKRNIFYKKYKNELSFRNLLLVKFIYRNKLIYKIASKIKRIIKGASI